MKPSTTTSAEETRITRLVCEGGRTDAGRLFHATAPSLLLPHCGVYLVEGPRAELVVDPLQMALLDPGTIYRYQHHACCGEDCGTLVTLGGPAGRQILERPDGPDTVRLRAEDVLLLHRLVAAWADPATHPEEVIALRWDLVRTFLELRETQETSAADRSDLTARAPEIVRETILEVAKGSGAGHYLDSVAHRAGYSKFHFCRIFRWVTGTTVHRYLIRLRLREALRRLANGTEDLTDLALHLGFSSHSHFTASFRNEYRLTPSKVRSLLASESPAIPAERQYSRT